MVFKLVRKTFERTYNFCHYLFLFSVDVIKEKLTYVEKVMSFYFFNYVTYINSHPFTFLSVNVGLSGENSS